MDSYFCPDSGKNDGVVEEKKKQKQKNENIEIKQNFPWAFF